jgi:hypothetical protein
MGAENLTFTCSETLVRAQNRAYMAPEELWNRVWCVWERKSFSDQGCKVRFRPDYFFIGFGFARKSTLHPSGKQNTRLGAETSFGGL